MWLRLSNRLWNSDKIINLTPVYDLILSIHDHLHLDQMTDMITW